MIRNNGEKSRFELEREGVIAVLDYRIQDDKIHLLHTGVPADLKGQGVGSALARHALKYALENHLKLIVICPFIRSYMRNNPDWRAKLFDNERN